MENQECDQFYNNVSFLKYVVKERIFYNKRVVIYILSITHEFEVANNVSLSLAM
jgi:hypothetical protein